MKILIMNWRDTANPSAGGAEQATERIAAIMASRGHEITIFSSIFPGAKPEDRKEGYRIVRRGNRLTVRWHAWKWYKRQKPGCFDIVVDEINTLPFFTPLYAKIPVVAYIHQLAREVWRYETPFLVSSFGYFLEPVFLRFYRKTPFITVSESTRADLIGLGFSQDGIRVIQNGLDLAPAENAPKPEAMEEPALLYFGSLRPMKRVDQVIKAMAAAIKEQPGLRLWIAGGGRAKDKTRLAKLADKLGLGEKVVFLGSVSEEERARLFSEAALLLHCSVREGWGLVVIEANAFGTPAIVYDVPGLRDAVVDGETGLVVKENTPEAMASAIVGLLADKEVYQRYGINAWRRSKTFSWDKAAGEFLDTLTASTSERE